MAVGVARLGFPLVTSWRSTPSSSRSRPVYSKSVGRRPRLHSIFASLAEEERGVSFTETEVDLIDALIGIQGRGRDATDRQLKDVGRAVEALENLKGIADPANVDNWKVAAAANSLKGLEIVKKNGNLEYHNTLFPGFRLCTSGSIVKSEANRFEATVDAGAYFLGPARFPVKIKSNYSMEVLYIDDKIRITRQNEAIMMIHLHVGDSEVTCGTSNISKKIFIEFINGNHYVQLSVHDDCPLPPIFSSLKKYRQQVAIKWDLDCSETLQNPRGRSAMDEEMHALWANGIWELVLIPHRKSRASCKLFFTHRNLRVSVYYFLFTVMIYYSMFLVPHQSQKF